ncbi:C4 [Sweet potato leaf curl virus]|uniref:C4 n=2 Tax=Begomovirus TaxID=10814 RepID=F2X902_9GEMI|nr:C4 [Sweet potato leaf curl Sao Paulo virus]ACZ65974.1 C4 [Sweet potato begomovirus]ADZ96662.1 C4 [Sweet potato leaf curl virus]ADZ96686.1 C4 [Sweet potato leaf curl Sao Paulo virus]
MKMGNLISMCFSSSRGITSARIKDSSTWSLQPGQHISTQTFRERNPAPTSSPTSIRMETLWNGENSRSTADLLEEASRLLMTQQQRP